jgi:fluoride exporter
VSRALVWAGVALLGGAGGLARFLLDAVVSERTAGRLPYGTFVVNLSGATLLGVLAGVALRGDALLLCGTALLGSYTTFSTWMLESHRLGEDGHGRALAANVVVSLALGLAGVALGRWLGGLL